METEKRIERRNIVKCAMICFVIAFFSFIYFIIKGQGIFILRDDFNTQQIPFTVALHNAILDGGISGWNWNLDLGTSTLQGFSFYELGSPFFWLSMIFPSNIFPYIVGWIYMLKYVVAGVLAYYYLTLFIQNKKVVTIGAVLYAFSGFSTTNLLFYHFHDVVAFFPLLLIGLEKMMKNKKNMKLFVFAVFLNCIVNYFFFVEEVIFLILYYIFRFLKKNMKENFIGIIRCLFSGIWGVGIAAVIFLPSVMYISGNPRNTVSLFLNNIIYDSRYFLFILKGFLLPGEAMNAQSCVIESEFNSTSCFIPLIGLSFSIAYVIKKKDWLSKFLILLAIMSFSPILSSVFLLGTEVTQRWWYMFALMLILASCYVAENPQDYPVKKSTVYYGFLILVFGAALKYVNWDENVKSLVIDEKKFQIYFLMSLGGIIFTIICVYCKKRRENMLICGIVFFSAISTIFTIHNYRVGAELPSEYKTTFEIGTKLEVYNEQYRYAMAHNVLGLTGGMSGLGNASSTNANSIDEFEDLFEFYQTNYSLPKESVTGLQELLAGRYYETTDNSDGTAFDEIVVGDKTFYIKEKPACPIGYSVSNYITKDDLRLFPVEYRGLALLSAVVMDEEIIDDKMKQLLNRQSMDTIEWEKDVLDYVADNSAGAVNDFHRDGKGFTCSTDYESECFVYFSVPFDNGWSYYEDGKKKHITNSGGLMLVHVNEGKHQLTFTYKTPWFTEGLWITIISVVLFIGYCLITRSGKKVTEHK